MTTTSSNNPIIGQKMIHLPTNTVFTVLCSCASSRPRHHTRRHIMNNPHDYRPATVEELEKEILNGNH